MVIKTREKLIDVARQLFAHKGIENTTMSDIASASDKGRRTIYTYFKNKREIYNAVIERESEQLVSRLRDLVNTDLSPTEKLARYVDIRIDVVNESVSHHRGNNVLRALLIREFKRMERIRTLAVGKELEMLRGILDDGLATGEFNKEMTECVYAAMIFIYQGLELSYLRNDFQQTGVNRDHIRDNLKKLIITSIKI
jgi:AcrR family transcriptional regulator